MPILFKIDKEHSKVKRSLDRCSCRSMERWLDDDGAITPDDAMVRWRRRWFDGSMMGWQLHDGATVRWRWCHDGDEVMVYRVIATSLSRHRTITLSTFLHMCCLEKMATGLSCSLQLLWFIYNVSNTPPSLGWVTAIIKTIFSSGLYQDIKKRKKTFETFSIIS